MLMGGGRLTHHQVKIKLGLRMNSLPKKGVNHKEKFNANTFMRCGVSDPVECEHDTEFMGKRLNVELQFVRT